MSNDIYIKLIRREFDKDSKAVVRVNYILIDDDIAITQEENIRSYALSQFEHKLNGVDKCEIKKVQLLK